MMKYLLVGLILIAGGLGHAAGAPARPARTFAAAAFAATAPSGIVTEVEIFLDTTRAFSQVGFSIHQRDPRCAEPPCPGRPLVAADTVQLVAPGVVVIDRRLRQAAVHGTLRVHDRVTNTERTVRIDAVWTGSGVPACDARYDQFGCDRAAAVTGDVTIGAIRLIARQTVPDGLLQWREPAW